MRYTMTKFELVRKYAGQNELLPKRDRIMQGIITSYAVTEDDEAKGKRNGGFGSTDGQKD